MALATDRDARAHQLQIAPSELAPLMTCDAACARLVDMPASPVSRVTGLDANAGRWVSIRAGRLLPYQTLGQARPDTINCRCGWYLQRLQLLLMSLYTCGILNSLQLFVCLELGRSDVQIPRVSAGSANAFKMTTR
jgi:hypothetical protein